MQERVKPFQKVYMQWVGIGFAILYWFIESIVDSFLFHQGSLAERMFAPDLNELWMRLFALSLLIIFGFYSQLLIEKRNLAEEEVRKINKDLEHRVIERTAQLENAKVALKMERDKLVLFRALLDRSNDAIEMVDPETGSFLDMNERGLLDLGYSREELPFLRVWDIDPAVDQPSFTKIIEGLRKSGSIIWNGHHQRKDGSQFPVEINIKYVQLDRGYVITVVRDVTERKRAEDALLTSEEKFRGLAEQSIVGTCIIQDGKFAYLNQHLAEILDFRQEEMLGLQVLDLVAERDRDTVKENMRKRLSGEAPYLRYTFHALKKGGSEVPMEVHGSAMIYLGRPAIIATVLDITERKAAEEKIKHLAYHDPLTDLPNRTLFYDRLNQAILAGRRENEPVALMFLDMNRFKEINDTYGHDCGDFLLKQLSHRLRGILRASDTVARIGGDEFAIILPQPEKIEGAVRAAKKIIAAMKPPFNLVKTQVNVTVSIGIAVFPEHGEDINILLQRADSAMYKAKHSGQGFVVYVSGEEKV